ncbi:MAG: hypothetical protein AB7K09_14035 [Planctomycetota bacterium]
MYWREGGIYTDLDIVTAEYNIEAKGGKLNKTQAEALVRASNKPTIILSEQALSERQVRELLDAGIQREHIFDGPGAVDRMVDFITE